MSVIFETTDTRGVRMARRFALVTGAASGMDRATLPCEPRGRALPLAYGGSRGPNAFELARRGARYPVPVYPEK